MQKYSLLTSVLILGAGALIGFFITNITTLSIYELKTPATSGAVYANNSNIAAFNGAWISSTHEAMKDDINSVVVHCWKDKNICNVAQANVQFNDLFTNNISYYEVSEWSDSGQITAVSSSLCELRTLKADVKTKSVTLTESRNDSAGQSVCPTNDGPVVHTLGQKGF